MYYFLFAIPLIIYFELLGRYLFCKLDKKPLDFSFPLGFVFTMAVLYVLGWPISSFNGPSIAYVCLVLAFFAVTLFLIFRNIRKLDFHFSWKLWVLFLVLTIVEVIISYNRTLGEPHGFDALYYINYIGYNVDVDALNSLHPHFGTTPNTFITAITYVYQAYYYFISSFVYIVKNLGNLIGLTIETMPTIVWPFQILSTTILIATSLTCIKELDRNNKILNIGFVILLVLFMGNFYYNNAYGWIGNNFRMSIHALATLFLFRYFKDQDKQNLYLFYLCMLGMCAVASTGTFAFIFILFGLFFYFYDKRPNLLKEYAVVLFVPTLNILTTKLGAHVWLCLATLVLFVIIYFLNDFILKLFQNKYLRIGTIAALTLFMVVASALYTGSVFDIHLFFDNYSEYADMSWDYFDFYDLRHWIFNLLVLIPMFFYLIKERKHPFSIAAWVLIVCIYNPFCCSFMNKVNWVYYRTYDLFINPYTLIYFINYLLDCISFKKVMTGLVLVSSIVLSCLQIPRYYHDMFIPDEDYNPVFKMENAELSLIYNVRQMIEDYGIENPRIINTTFYMNTFIEDSTYLFGKEKVYDWNHYSENSYELFKIFYPQEEYYEGTRSVDEYDFTRVVQYLNECDYDILIVDYGKYEWANGEYIQVAAYLDEEGTYTRSPYSTSKYAVYYLK